MAQQQQQQITLEWIKNNMEQFAKMDEKSQKNTLGTLMYPMIKEIVQNKGYSQDLTPKVTGMLIDFEVLTMEDVISSLSNNTLLIERTVEAVDLIQNENKQKREA